MNKLITYIFLLGLLVSCDKYVDIQPKGLVIPATTADLRLVMNNNGVFAYGHELDFFMNDDVFIPASQVNPLRGAIFYGLHISNIIGFEDFFFLDEEPDPNWYRNYQIVTTANYVLERLSTVSGTQAEKNELEGEAKVQRAYAYFTLVSLYAKHYAAGDPNEPESGVPVNPTFANSKISQKRQTIQQVYDLIIHDLEESKSLLTRNSAPHKFEATRAVAHAALARVYLNIEDYPKSLSNANDALAIQNTLLHYPTDLAGLGNTLGNPNTGDDVEIIFQKMGYIPAIAVFTPSFAIAPFTYMTSDLIALYDQEHDTRFTRLASFNPAADAYRWTGSDQFSLSCMSAMTVSEMLLISAESNARLGNIAPALADVNRLREHRIDSSDPAIVHLSGTTQDEVLSKILSERRRELAFRGRRFFDIKRLNAVDNAGIAIVRDNLEGQSVTLPANDPRWAMPIPGYDINFNTEIKQNPRD